MDFTAKAGTQAEGRMMSMSYVVTWLDHEKIIAELEFDNLFSAEDHVSKSSRAYQRQGATSARVWNGRATYFKIDWPDEKPTRNGLVH